MEVTKKFVEWGDYGVDKNFLNVKVSRDQGVSFFAFTGCSVGYVVLLRDEEFVIGI